MKVPDPACHLWVTKAENDRLNIQNNISADRVPWDTVCFHAQQAVEKYLKAFLVFHNRTVTKTHDLVALLTVAMEIDAELEELDSHCHRLTYYGVGARYPDELYQANEKDGREMIDASDTVCQAIRKGLSLE